MSCYTKSRIINAAKTKQKIYDSAASLIESRDYNDISVESIVKMAGVSKGTFYVHFASKDDLLRELVNDYVKKADLDYKSFLASLSDDTPADVMLLSLIGQIADLMIDMIGIDKTKAVYKAQITKEFYTESIISNSRELFRVFNDVLQLGIARGEFKDDIPLDILTKHLVMAIRGVTYEWCIRDHEFDYKAEALKHFELLLGGLQI